jgi:hypothetical protein
VQFQRYTRVGRSAGVGAPIAGLLRVVDPPSPKVGAVCGKAARTDLSGGREATRVPTATSGQWPDFKRHAVGTREDLIQHLLGESLAARDTLNQRHPLASTESWGSSRSWAGPIVIKACPGAVRNPSRGE